LCEKTGSQPVKRPEATRKEMALQANPYCRASPLRADTGRCFPGTPHETCHPERSEGSAASLPDRAGQRRSFAALRMTNVTMCGETPPRVIPLRVASGSPTSGFANLIALTRSCLHDFFFLVNNVTSSSNRQPPAMSRWSCWQQWSVFRRSCCYSTASKFCHPRCYGIGRTGCHPARCSTRGTG